MSVAAYLRNPSPDQVGETKVTHERRARASRRRASTRVRTRSTSWYRHSGGCWCRSDRAGAEPRLRHRPRAGIRRRDACARRVGYFNNTFEDLLEFLSRTQLVRAGVPPAVAAGRRSAPTSTPRRSTRRASSCRRTRAIGARLPSQCVVHLSRRGGHGSLRPDRHFNPAFPGIPIGAYSPLVGERPFRRPANSGTLFVAYTTGPFDVALSGYFAGTRDDSTFLSDGFFGNSLLLPNQDLDPRLSEDRSQRLLSLHPPLQGVHEHRQPPQSGLLRLVRLPVSAGDDSRRRVGRTRGTTRVE